MGYRLNRLTEPVFIAVSKILLTDFGIHYRFESCVPLSLGYLSKLTVVPSTVTDTLFLLDNTSTERDLGLDS